MKTTNKALIALTLSTVLFMGLAGCSDKKAAPDTTAPAVEQKVDTAQPTANDAAPAVTKDAAPVAAKDAAPVAAKDAAAPVATNSAAPVAKDAPAAATPKDHPAH